jgi:murein DD-endopeptidase MepM/ murein hydrolase activator NlpD
LTGSVVLDEENSTIYRYPPGKFLHPLRMAVRGEEAYVLDGGALKAMDLAETGAWRVLSPPENSVEGVPIKELGDLALASNGSLLLLDRSGDLYRYSASGRWSLERMATMPGASPRQYLASVATDEEDIFLLDINLGQIWRHQEEAEVVVEDPRLEEAIDLAAHGDLYVLEEGGLIRVSGPSYETVEEIRLEGILEPSLLSVDERYIYLLDGYRRLVVLDKDSMEEIREYRLSDGGQIRAFFVQGGRLYIASRDGLYIYPGRTVSRSVVTVPQWPLQPHDPAILEALPPFILPIEGGSLPETSFRLPGAPRSYRYGVHEGIDFYMTKDGAVTTDTPLLAVADGVVVRADQEYVSPTEEEMEEMLSRALEAHYTPPDLLDRLRGRQVWIDHGEGVVTRYCHLERLAEGLTVGQEVKQGALIAYAGNSGTPQALDGPQVGVHLHLEIRVGEGYLGQYLRPVEVQRWLAQIFQ